MGLLNPEQLGNVLGHAYKWAADHRGSGEGSPMQTPRVAPDAPLVKFALLNPESTSASSLGVKKHLLTPEQIDELDTRVSNAIKPEPGFKSFLTAIMDYLATAVQALIGSFSKNDRGIRSYGALLGERRALRNAGKVYEALSKPGIDGTAPYADFAEKVSGVKPDGQGGYKPTLDDKGQTTGLYHADAKKAADPYRAHRAAEEDRGIRPTNEQMIRIQAIYKEETTNLLKRSDIRAIVAEYRPREGEADYESKSFVNDPRINSELERITDRILKDDKVKSSGSFDYDTRRDAMIGRVKWSLANDYKALTKDIVASNRAVTPVPTAADIVIEIRKPGNEGGFQGVERAWYAQAYEALKPADPSANPEETQKSRMGAQEFAKAATGMFKDSITRYPDGGQDVSFSQLAPERMKEELNKLAATSIDPKKLEKIVETMAEPTRTALEQAPPLAIQGLKKLVGNLMPNLPNMPVAPSVPARAP